MAKLTDGSKIAYTTSLNSKTIKDFRIYCAVNQIYQNEVLEGLILNLLSPTEETISNTSVVELSTEDYLVIDKNTLSDVLQSILKGVEDPLSFVNKALEHYVAYVINNPTIDSHQGVSISKKAEPVKEVIKTEEAPKPIEDEVFEQVEVSKKEITSTLDNTKESNTTKNDESDKVEDVDIPTCFDY